MKTTIESNEFDKMRNDPDNYKFGFFYFNKKDPRFIIPKKTGLGITLNFANPKSYLIILAIIIFSIIMGNIDKIFK